MDEAPAGISATFAAMIQTRRRACLNARSLFHSELDAVEVEGPLASTAGAFESATADETAINSGPSCEIAR